MKAKIIISLMAVIVSPMAQAQKISADKVPQAIMQAFKTKFPGAVKVAWEMESKDEYEASFTLKAVEQSSSFDLKGRWMETSVEIEFSELPDTIQQTLKKEFPGYKFTELSKSENARYGFCFEAEAVKGSKRVEVVVSLKGAIISREVEEEEED